MKFRDLTGNVYGRLTVVCLNGKQGTSYMWECLCSCGNSKIVRRNSLQQGATRSCGCLAAEVRADVNTTHGMSKTKVYGVWSELVNRATNKEHANAKYYVGKGVGICEEWLDFENFYRDMGEPPKNTWIERIDNSLGYNKYNCKWESPSRQCSNRSSGRNTSGRIGVYAVKDKWKVKMIVDKKRIEAGPFESYNTACAKIESLEIEHLGQIRKV